jgi:uncharacterized repeat protein (TIGR01451 family)
MLHLVAFRRASGDTRPIVARPVLLTLVLALGAAPAASADSADLRVQGSQSTPTPTVGSQLTYFIELFNDGPDTARNVKVIDTLPSNAQLVSAPPYCSAPVNGKLVCQPSPDLLAHAGGTGEIVVVPTAAGQMVNTAQAVSDTPDPNPYNNVVTITANAADTRDRKFECNDGLDNDGDSWVDINDPGCANGLDDSERHDAIRLYAPNVHLHPHDTYRPMDPSVFVRHSKLRFALDRCPDKTVHPRLDTDAEVAKLAAGGYRWRRDCLIGKMNIRSNQLTALPVWDNPHHVPKNLRAGFFLDLDDGWRKGVDPTVNSTLPLYYSYEKNRFIAYWFFYGFNNRRLDKHEGDWEKIVVSLKRGDKAKSVSYYQHYCNPDGSDFGTQSWSKMLSKGYLTQRTHPQVWSAIGSHASYPKNVHKEVFPCGPTKGGLDQTAGGGPVWHTWDAQLINASTADWFGYGGSWGERKAIAGTKYSFGWGPLGPSPVMYRWVQPHPAF